MSEAQSTGVADDRSVDRLINFSDAVVAVAVTLLALPLVEISGPQNGETVWDVINDNSGPVISFLFTFYVVTIMWMAHNRIVRGLSKIDAAVYWLNTSWLVLIVLLPWISSMYGEADMVGGDNDPTDGVGLLYWLTMALISLVGTLLGDHLNRTPGLRRPGARPRSSGVSNWRGLTFTAFFAIIGVATIVVPDIARWLPLGIIPLSIWMRDRGTPVVDTSQGD